MLALKWTLCRLLATVTCYWRSCAENNPSVSFKIFLVNYPFNSGKNTSRKCKKKLSAYLCFETFSELAKGDRTTLINDKSNTEKPLEELGSIYWSALNKEL